jgi:hypothetical protein
MGANGRQKKAFLAAYLETGNITRAAEAAKCHRNSHYNWLEDDDYAAAFADAKEAAADGLEAEARRRAVEGLRKYKFHSQSGRPLLHPETGDPYFEHDYSDTLLIFLLKGAMPEKYADRHRMAGDPNKPLILRVVYDE